MANRYWVGGTNLWDSTTTAYWSATSGGSGGASVPTSADDVYFDAGTTMTVTGTVVCRSLTLDASAAVGYSAGSTIQIYGSLYFGPSYVGWFGDIQFLSTSSGNTLYMGASSSFGFGTTVTFNGAGGGWTLTTDVNFDDVVLTQGTLSTGGFGIAASSFNSSNTNTRTLAFGSGSIVVSNFWDTSTSTNLTVTYSLGASIYAGGYFYGGGKSWPSLFASNGAYPRSVTIYGSNTFYRLGASSTFANPATLTLESGTTTTVLNDISLDGVASSPLYLTATGASAATISKASGTVTATYTDISNSTATGGAVFNAGIGCIDSGNNTGWIFFKGGGNFFNFF